MKIGILTFHRSYNYGAFLQCYSLVKRLESDFEEAEIEVIDYMYDDNLGYRRQVELAQGDLKEKLILRNKSIQSTVQTLPLSPERIIDASPDGLYNRIGNRYDIIIVGSDAVFNWNGKGLPNVFMPNKKPEGTMFVSYAASAHGIDYRKSGKDVLKTAGDSFSKFSFLGVRDDETIKLIKESGCDIIPVHTCDPTAFLDLDSLPVNMDALRNKLEKHGIDLKKPIIGIMADDVIGKGIKRHLGNKAQIVAVYHPNKYADYFLDDLNPFEWARVFSLFDVMITHYFHGTMFSLKNECPVIITERAVNFRKNYRTKIMDLLSRLNLEELYYPMDIATETLWQRFLLKIGVSDYKYRKGLYAQIEDRLNNPLSKGYILSKLQQESKSYQNFYEYLKCYI